VFLELPSRRPERIAHRDVRILVSLVDAWIAVDDHVLAGNVNADGDVELLALMVMEMGEPDDDLGALDLIVDALELPGPLVDPAGERVTAIDPVEPDL